MRKPIRFGPGLAPAKSDYVEFVADAHYSAFWENDKRSEVEDKIVFRLNNDKDIDLMIAMGTWAGKGLANFTVSAARGAAPAAASRHIIANLRFVISFLTISH